MGALLKLRLFARSIGREALMLFLACRHAGTPRSVKFGALLLLLYVISPIDVIPDFFGIFGWADDLALLTFGIPWLLRRVPANVQADIGERANTLASRFGFGANR
jgi:uncharacterized membrane protein YkvA (DUF1232 family)